MSKDVPRFDVRPENVEQKLRDALAARPDPIDTTLVAPSGPRIDPDDLVDLNRTLPEPGSGNPPPDQALDRGVRPGEPADADPDGEPAAAVRPDLAGRFDELRHTDLLVDETLVAREVEVATGSGSGSSAPSPAEGTSTAGDARTPVVEDVGQRVVDRVPPADPATPASPEEREAAVNFLTDFGVPGAAGLSDTQLKAALTEAAEKMRAGAEHDGDLAALPTRDAYTSAGEVEAVGGGSRLNPDGSITLFRSDGTVLKTIEAGHGGGDPRANALQAEFDLPDFSAVPSNTTYEKVVDAEAAGGDAVVHVGGAVDIYDSGGKLVEHIPPDVFSEVGQAFEHAGENLSTLDEQFAAIPGTLAEELDQAAAEVGAALGIGGEPEGDDGAGQGAPGAAPASGSSGDESGDDDQNGDGDDQDDQDGDDGDGDDESDDSEQSGETDAADGSDDSGDDDPSGGDSDAAGTPLPDDVDGNPAARDAFLDSPLGAQQLRETARGLDLAAGGGLVDPADTNEGGGAGGVVDPTTGAVTPGPAVEPGGAIGPRIESGDGFAVTDRDLDGLELFAGGGPAAGSGDPFGLPSSPSAPPLEPHSPVQPVWFGGGRGPAREDISDADAGGPEVSDDPAPAQPTDHHDDPSGLQLVGDGPTVSSPGLAGTGRFDGDELSSVDVAVDGDLSGS